MSFTNTVKLFCLLFLWPALVWARTPVEVVINGTDYPSFEAYQAAKEHSRNAQKPDPAGHEKAAVPVAEAIGIKRLQAAGYEHGVKRVMTDFKQNWDNPAPKWIISPSELEERLGALVDGRKEPVLVVSESNKLRVTALGKDK